MKKFLKILAATAAIASVVPFHGEGDEKGGTIEALLWKAKWTIDPDYQSDPDVNITIGFNNPFKKKNAESELFADELVVDYCCDSTLIHDCTQHEEKGRCCAPDAEYDDVDASTLEDNCQCGDNCSCNEEPAKSCGGDCGCAE